MRKITFFKIVVFIVFNVISSFKIYAAECGDCDETLTGTLSNTDYERKVYCVPSDISIAGSVSFTQSELVMGDRVTITVQNGAILYINASHLYSCAAMWQGINVIDGGKLIITGDNEGNSSFIEDAIVAVNFDMNDDDGTYTNVFSVDNTIFNRNRISISISNYHANYSSTLTYPFKVRNTIFTCRDIPFTPTSLSWFNLATVKYSTSSSSTTYPNTPDVMTDPYIDESVYSSTNSAAFLKPPYNSTYFNKSHAGISLQNIGVHDGGYNAVVIGSDQGDSDNPNTNIFDNQINGIKAEESNLVVYNCTFQKKYPEFSFGGIQRGIYAFNHGIGEYSLRDVNPNVGFIPNNAFFDPDYGIDCEYYYDVDVINCDIRSAMDVTAYDPLMALFIQRQQEVS